MKKWKIVADSICDIRSVDNLPDTVAFESVPLTINIDDQTFYDDTSIDMNRFRQALSQAKTVASTACPAPDHYAEAFKGAENVICFCVTKELSGSYSSAMLGRDLLLEENPTLNIHVVNTKSAGAEINIQVERALQLATDNISFDEMVEKVTDFGNRTNILFVLESINNLVRAGRVSKIIGQMVGLLNIVLIGQRTDIGTIELAQKARGTKRAYKILLEELRNKNYMGGRLEIGHANNLKAAETIKNKILEKFPEADISIRLVGALCEFYAETGGIMVGFEQN